MPHPYRVAFSMVRVGGIEPPSQVWKTCILTVVLHPRTARHCIISVLYNKAMGLLSSRFNRPDTGIIHSNSIASTGSNTFGAASPESFAQRKIINHNREHVPHFRSAGVIHSYRHDASSYTARNNPYVERDSAGSGNPIAHPGLNNRSHAQPTRMAPPRTATPSTTYREPPRRNYNPYS